MAGFRAFKSPFKQPRITEYTDLGEKNVFATKTQADAFFRNRQYDQAKVHYLAAIDALRVRIRQDEAATDIFLGLQEEKAKLITSLALVYEATHQLTAAEECFELSLRIFQELLVRKASLRLDEVQTVILLHLTANMVGDIFYQNCDYEKAMSFYKIALEAPLPISEEPIARKHKQRIDPLTRKVSIHCNDKKNKECAKKKMLMCRADTLHSMANIFSILNDTEKSINLYLQVLKILTEVHGESHPHVAIALHNIAACYIREKDYETAIHMYRRILKCSVQRADEYNPLTFDALVGIGMALTKSGELDEALIVYEAALQLPKHDIRQKVKYAAVHYAIGEIYKDLNDEEQAFTHFNMSIETYKLVGFSTSQPQVKAIKKNIDAINSLGYSARVRRRFNIWDYFDTRCH